jgi:PadR family transcriptional regulator, regulatory protein PadR
MNIGALEQHVLMAIVALHPDAYGVSIQDHIRQRTGYEHSIGSVYAALDRLEEKGFIRPRLGESTPERGGRRKLYFTVTATGQATLRESLRAIASMQRGLRWREAFRLVEVIP